MPTKDGDCMHLGKTLWSVMELKFMQWHFSLFLALGLHHPLENNRDMSKKKMLYAAGTAPHRELAQLTA
eukprot:79551-Pelagomonas_calceolata.AAC.1